MFESVWIVIEGEKVQEVYFLNRAKKLAVKLSKQYLNKKISIVGVDSNNNEVEIYSTKSVPLSDIEKSNMNMFPYMYR